MKPQIPDIRNRRVMPTLTTYPEVCNPNSNSLNGKAGGRMRGVGGNLVEVGIKPGIVLRGES